MNRAIIFDWDGTLADTRRVIVTAFQKSLEKYGCIVSDDFIERRIGIGTKKTILEAFRDCNLRLKVFELEKVATEKIRIQSELTELVRLFDGAIELLENLHGEIGIALATMSNRKVVDKLLLEKDIAKYFDLVVCADEVGNPKPDPEIFLLSAKKLNVNPRDCIVIEDSIFGIKAAKKANMKCIAVTSGVYTRQELENAFPDIVIGSLNEKEKIIAFIFAEKY